MRFEEAHPSLFQAVRNSRSWHEPSYPFMELTAVVPSNVKPSFALSRATNGDGSLNS